MPPDKVNLPDNWNEIVKEFAGKVQEVLDANGQKAVCWTLLDVPSGTAWNLINARYNVCWQNIRDRSQFQKAFSDDGVLRNGMREIPALRPASALLEKSLEDGKLYLKVKRSGA